MRNGEFLPDADNLFVLYGPQKENLNNLFLSVLLSAHFERLSGLPYAGFLLSLYFKEGDSYARAVRAEYFLFITNYINYLA